MDYQIRKPTEEDHPEIRDLFEESLGTFGSREFWEWKHLDNPFGPTYWLVAEASGKLVGARAFMQWQWQTGENKHRAVRAVDTATHPNWRRRGIFTNLTTGLVEEIRQDGVDFIFNTPNEKSRPGYLKMGWGIVKSVPIWFKAIHPLKIARKIVPAGRRQTRENVQFDEPNVAEFLEKAPVESIADSAFQREPKFHTVRSTDYYRWRFSEIPDEQYRASWTNENPGAFALYRRRTRSGFEELMLSELTAPGGLEGIRTLRRLLDDVLSQTEADYAVACAARNTTEMWALTLNGFVPIPRLGPTLVYRSLSENTSTDRLENWSSWRCSIGDLAVF